MITFTKQDLEETFGNMLTNFEINLENIDLPLKTEYGKWSFKPLKYSIL